MVTPEQEQIIRAEVAKYNADANKIIDVMNRRDSGMTYEEIGNLIGATKQRVLTIYRRGRLILIRNHAD